MPIHLQVIQSDGKSPPLGKILPGKNRSIMISTTEDEDVRYVLNGIKAGMMGTMDGDVDGGGEEYCPLTAEFVARTRIDGGGKSFILDDRRREEGEGPPPTSSREDLDRVVTESTRLLSGSEPGGPYGGSVPAMRMQVRFHAARCSIRRRLRDRCGEISVRRTDLARSVVVASSSYTSTSSYRGGGNGSGLDGDGCFVRLQRDVFDYMMKMASGESDGECQSSPFPSPSSATAGNSRGPPSAAAAAATAGGGGEVSRREIGAALESVFPPVCLKSFSQLSFADRVRQLSETSKIVLGIRIFSGTSSGVRGLATTGINASALVAPAAEGLADLENCIAAEVEALDGRCDDVIDEILLSKRRAQEEEGKERGGGAPLKPPEGETHVGSGSSGGSENLEQKLTYLRQYRSFCFQIRSKSIGISDRLRTTVIDIGSAADDLRSVVGNRTSAPKEAVYPRFRQLADLWTAARAQMASAESTAYEYCALKRYAPPPDESDRRVSIGEAEDATARPGGKATTTAAVMASATTAAAATLSGQVYERERTSGRRWLGLSGACFKPLAAEGRRGGTASVAAQGHGGSSGSSVGGGEPPTFGEDGSEEEEPVLLVADGTPNFSCLRLEYEGFCCAALRNGIVVVGDPSLGVVRYSGQNFAFHHEDAVRAFVADPKGHVDAVDAIALRRPDLLYLLNLWTGPFDSGIAAVLFPADGSDLATELAASPRAEDDGRRMRDASTETPVHFVQENIDPEYEWNEWELRRKALLLADQRGRDRGL